MALTVGVAGCGVAGLTAAVMLARAGHRVTIHEQAPALSPVGAGVLLQPSGQMVLRAMGLFEEVARESEVIDRLTAATHKGKTLIDLPYGELGEGWCAYGMRRGILFSVLHAAAVAAGVRVETGQRVEGYAMSGGKVFFKAGGRGDGPYDFVLAADGARSVLRQGARARVKAYPHGALWTQGPCAAVRGRLWQVCRGTKELCGVLPTGGGSASLFWSMRNDAMESHRARGFARWREDVLRLCPEAEEIFGEVTDFEAVKFVSYMHVNMRMPRDQGCLFVGDAAHAMSPHLGQGINLALIDGYAFARALAACGDFPRACAAYARERAAHLRAYRIITYMLSPFFQSRGVIKGWGRDIFLPLMPKVPWLRRQMIVAMAGCRAGLLGGRWRPEG